MLAIINWSFPQTLIRPGRQALAALVAGLILAAAPLAGEVAAPPEAFAHAAEKRFREAQAEVQKHPDDPEVAWKFARACFDWAEFATSKKERADRGSRGVEVCRQLIATHPDLAPAYYYLGLNLGQLARTKTLGALPIVRDMEVAFLKAISLDPGHDHAGAHRNLGLLYRDAPGWPASIGNRSKARQHLERTIKLFPHYPGNRITYLETLLEWDEEETVKKAIPEVQKILDGARTSLTGPEWASSWAEWQARWKKIQEQVGLTPKPIQEPTPPE